MYKAREQPEILEDLKAHSTSAASKIEGSFTYDMLAANAIEFAKTEIELEEAYKAAFADTAEGEYLTKRAAEYGVLRKTATKARGVLTARGTGTIPRGTLFMTETGTRYAAVEEKVISGSGAVPVEAVEDGAGGNTAAGTVTKIPMSIPGITAVTNEKEIAGGYDEESDAELRARYLVIVRTPATSGNKYHYYNWAMSVPGVGACRVLPLWNGAGTVKVLVIGADHKAAPAELIEKVRTYIEDVRPIGATVTVASPVPKQVRITANIAGTWDKAAFIADVNAYIRRKSFDLRYLSAAQVGDILMNQTSVVDYENLLLNGSIKVTADEDELLVVEEAELHEL